MALPIVAIIGRPNVGKSSLLNALAGQMISIVEPTAGVTRDRITTIIEWQNHYFELVDTGGYGIVDRDDLSTHIEAQIRQAIESADLILFLVDIRDGLLPLDEKLAQLLRKENPEVILVANKADTVSFFPSAAEFAKLGFGQALCISTTNNLNKNLLLDQIVEKIDHLPTEKPSQAAMKIAVVGKRNAGKSSLTNAIVGEQRVIVSEVPGTTRDAVDIRFERNGKTIVIIDTAGVRKKGKFENDIEFYSYTRVTRSIKRADVILFMIDSTLPISQVDKKLAGLLTEQNKACILVINKWDLASERATSEDYEDYLTRVLPGLKYAPIAFTIATEATNIEGVLDLTTELFNQLTTQIPTSQLNKALELVTTERYPSASGKTLPKIYYATQVAINPVTILMFVNKPNLFEETYRRFLVNRLREILPVKSVPIRLLARSHRTELSAKGEKTQ